MPDSMLLTFDELQSLDTVAPGTRDLIRNVRPRYQVAGETRWSDSLSRIATGLYPDDVDRRMKLIRHLEQGTIVPAGRVMAGAGTTKDVTWLNCFVCNTLEDSMRDDEGVGIMSSLANVAFSMQMGGGVGTDFSPLRPRGAVVRKQQTIAKGPIHFMHMWNAMSETICSSGYRVGAMMATLDVHHPDLWHPDQFKVDPITKRLIRPTFISAKKQPGALTQFNMSVLVSDAFMTAVHEDKDWELYHEIPPATTPDDPWIGSFFKNDKEYFIYQKVKARTIWNDIMRSNYHYAEPGVIFIDRINKYNNLWYREKIRCTNPCGEQPLPPWGACDLSSLNLVMFINDPFTQNACIDYNRLQDAVHVGVDMLDTVIDRTPYPLPQQREEMLKTRRIGLGITGLGSMLIMMRLRYGSDEAVECTEQIMNFIRNEAYKKSARLAQERGPFPALEPEYLDGPNIKSLPVGLQNRIKEHGIRNALLLSIAPVGSATIAQGMNSSGGAEPVFRFAYSRSVRQSDDTYIEMNVEDYAYTAWKRRYNDQLPPASYFVTAKEITPLDHVRMQAAVQKYVDSSVSKTVNVPGSCSFEDFVPIYGLAYQLGCKSCTTYRPDAESGRGSVLRDEDEPGVLQFSIPKRGKVLPGETYEIEWPGSPHPLFLTINDQEINGRRQPFEMFINTKIVEGREWHEAFTRMCSAYFRRGGDLSFIPDELSQIFSPKGGFHIEGKYQPSMLALIGSAIHQHLKKLGLTTLEPMMTIPDAEQCPACGALAFVHEEGCGRCKSCGHSTCG